MRHRRLFVKICSQGRLPFCGTLVLALVSLFSGFATPVEAPAVTALDAFVVETFVYEDLRLVKDVPRVMSECGLLVDGVILISYVPALTMTLPQLFK